MSTTEPADTPRRSPVNRRGISWPQPNSHVALTFWVAWVVLLVVALVVTAVCAPDGLGYPLLLVPFPALLIAAVVVPWLTPWMAAENAWVTLVATAFTVTVSGLAWFGAGIIIGPLSFAYAVVVRVVLAIYFRRTTPARSGQPG
ncbi:hypothetical protein ACLQ3C_09190 [Gordonia sp. DT30]|uniref:hypothetical protein n=1 Tax=unclassified Gordonia (in: high G+C Gram-positive bacteria) TaxID=2657482 RepID=UPI003CF7EE38